jgi:hypothetical protein
MSTNNAPIEPQFVEEMNKIAAALDQIFNGNLKVHDRKVCFTLLIAKFGEESRCNYISNGERKDIIVMMKETIARVEGQALKPGRA